MFRKKYYYQAEIKRMTMVYRHNVNVSNNLPSPCPFPDLPNCGCWKEAFLEGQRWWRRSPVPNLFSPARRYWIETTPDKVPKGWQQWMPLIFWNQTLWKITTKWSTTSLTMHRRLNGLVQRTSSLISATSSCKTFNLLAMSKILITPFFTTKNVIIHVSEFFTQMHQFTCTIKLD